MTRRYVNAKPRGPGLPWPSDAEYEALQAAKRQALSKTDAFVRVRDGSGNVAFVTHFGGSQFSSDILGNVGPRGELDNITTVKSWAGVPELEQTDMRRFRGGNLDIHAPDAQVHYVYEDVHVVRQRRFHQHHAPDQYIEHGQPQNAQIGMDPTQVRVHQSERIQQHHHERPQSALSAILFGVRKPAQQAPQPQYQQPALAPPQAVDRGFLLPAPAPRQQQPQVLAIAYQPEEPMQAQQRSRVGIGWRKR